jgi:hypothetical protein
VKKGRGVSLRQADAAGGAETVAGVAVAPADWASRRAGTASRRAGTASRWAGTASRCVGAGKAGRVDRWAAAKAAVWPPG